MYSSKHDVVAPPVQSDALLLVGSAVCLSYILVISTACSYQLTRSVITLLIYIREVKEGGPHSYCLFRSLSVGISSAFFCIPIGHDPNTPTDTASTLCFNGPNNNNVENIQAKHGWRDWGEQVPPYEIMLNDVIVRELITTAALIGSNNLCD